MVEAAVNPINYGHEPNPMGHDDFADNLVLHTGQLALPESPEVLNHAEAIDQSKHDIAILTALLNNEVPEALQLPRDYSDSAAMHEYKQELHVKQAKADIEARLQDRIDTHAAAKSAAESSDEGSLSGWSVTVPAGETTTTTTSPIIINKLDRARTVRDTNVLTPEVPAQKTPFDANHRGPFKVSMEDLKPLMPKPKGMEMVVWEPQPEETKQRMRGALGRAWKMLKEAPLKGFVDAQNKLKDFSEHSTKRKAASIAVGAVALGYVVMVGKGFIDHGHTTELAQGAPTGSPKHVDVYSEVTGQKGIIGADNLPQNKPKVLDFGEQLVATPPHAPAHPGAVGEAVHAVTIKPNSGDTIYHEAIMNLHRKGNAHTTLQERVKEMHRIMNLNHISEDQARSLASDGSVKLKV